MLIGLLLLLTMSSSHDGYSKKVYAMREDYVALGNMVAPPAVPFIAPVNPVPSLSQAEQIMLRSMPFLSDIYTHGIKDIHGSVILPPNNLRSLIIENPALMEKAFVDYVRSEEFQRAVANRGARTIEQIILEHYAPCARS